MIRHLNRIGAALVCALLAAAGCAGAAALLVPDRAPPTPQMIIAGGSEAATPPDMATSADAAPIAARLAHASAERGAVLAQQNCQSCHSLVQGAPASVGPNLFGVVDRPVAAAPGFGYSAALSALGGRWTTERLDRWLAGPQSMVPGTLMGFAGLPDPSGRADLIAFLAAQAPPPGVSAAGGPAFDALVARADPRQGEALVTAQCASCHSVEQGGAAGIGPDLFGVWGRGIAQAPDYRYSTALAARGGSWTTASLGSWLAAPSRFAPGTKMGFAGIADAAARAAVVAYLRTLHS